MGWMAVITCQQLRYLAENGKVQGQDQEAAAARIAANKAVRLARLSIKKQGVLPYTHAACWQRSPFLNTYYS